MQRIYHIFFKKPKSPAVFTKENYDLIAEVQVPDIRYIYYCCQNDPIDHTKWLDNITTVKVYQLKARNMIENDVFVDALTKEIWQVGAGASPKLTKIATKVNKIRENK